MNPTPAPSQPAATACNLTVFDPAVLQAMFGNDAAVVTSVLQTFLASMRDNLSELEKAGARQDLTSIAALAHKIAGACQMSGAQDLGHTTLALEGDAKLGNTAAVIHALSKMQTGWSQLQEAVATWTQKA